MAAKPQVLWDDVRLAYENSPETIAAIAERFGISRRSLSYQAKVKGWRQRRPKSPQPEGSQDVMVRRLYRTIDLKLAQLEARMAQQDDDLTVSDHERETRALGQLIRNFEKVTGLESGGRETRPQRAGGKAEGAESADDIDPVRLREELAERILRLREKQPDREG
jgi:hypothetical protein